jgi:hypothetical protein
MLRYSTGTGYTVQGRANLVLVHGDKINDVEGAADEHFQ